VIVPLSPLMDVSTTSVAKSGRVEIMTRTLVGSSPGRNPEVVMSKVGVAVRSESPTGATSVTIPAGAGTSAHAAGAAVLATVTIIARHWPRQRFTPAPPPAQPPSERSPAVRP
jgi:hypothetical protein